MLKSFFKRIIDTFSAWVTKERPPPEYPLCDFQRIQHELQPGDVILIEGRSHVSDIIRAITQSPWTHSALYIGHLHEIDDPTQREIIQQAFKGENIDDEQLIVESLLGKGTIIAPLRHYKTDHIRICRPRGIARSDVQSLITFIVTRLGVEYDVRQILDLARLLIPWSIIPKHWRSTLFEQNMGQSTKQICSTLLAQAFDSIHYPILPLVKIDPRTGMEFIRRNPRLFTPRDFDYSPYFDIVKYPMFDFNDEMSYKDLPWNKEGLLSNDAKGVISTQAQPQTLAKNVLKD
jgi:hypothetical protein